MTDPSHIGVAMVSTADAHPSLDELLTMLDSADLGDRLRAVNQARPLPPEEIYQVLQKACGDPSARVRYAAVSQMGSVPYADPSEPVALLRRILKEDPEFDVRAAAAASLGDLKQPEVLADLLQAYRQETEWLVQFSIVAALGELGNPEAFDTLVEALTAGSDLTRTAAAAALGDLGDARGIPVLEAYLSDEDWQLRYRICLSLEKIGGEAARPGLEHLAQDPIEQVATQAQEALQKLSA